MDEIAVLPVFFKLKGKRAIVAGGSAAAAWKVELLSAAGAAVTVIADRFDAAMIELGQAPPFGPIDLMPRTWAATDLVGAAIAIGDLEGDAECAAFRDAARGAGVPVNVIDKPAFCDFQFGTVVSRSPLVIGISTDGAAPVFGQAVRALIEALLPPGLQRWAVAARDWRGSVQALSLSFRARRRFWELFSDHALQGPEHPPSDNDRDRFLETAMAESVVASSALTLVCSGSGQLGDVTLGAIKALQSADVVVYAADLPPSIVGLARRESLKRPLRTDLRREAEAAEVTTQLQPGRHVVWIDRGDPTLCLRWAERTSFLATGQVSVRTVPGLGLCPVCDESCPAWSKARTTTSGDGT